MNNRFKFRVWTGHKMEYSVGVCPAGAFYYAGINPKDTACIETTLYDEKTHLWVKTMQFTGLTDVDGKEIYEGDLLKWKQTHVNKEYKNHDYNSPIFLTPTENEHIGEVVFDIINDIDDFYSPYVLGWGVKHKSGSVTSLYQLLQDYNQKSFQKIEHCYGAILAREIHLIGNIWENPELLK